jgi:2-methylcitrate dehydratase PrpD
MSVLAQLAAFATEATMASRDQALRDIQRRHFVDAIFAALVGRTTDEANALVPVLAGRPMGLAAASARLSEIDDIHCASCTTPSSAVVPAALMVIARDPDADAARLADAVWVGTELIARLGAAIDGARILYRGVWPTYFCAPLGVAATVGRLIGLDADAMANALAVALNLMAGGVGRRDAPRPPRWLLFATAVEAGATAARAAQAGFGGDPGLLDGSDWLQATHGISADTEALSEALGERCIYEDLSLKPYCSAKQSIAAADAVRALIADGLEPAEIESIGVRVPPEYAGMISRAASRDDRSSTLVSVAYQIALAILRPEARYSVSRANVPFDDGIVGLAARVSVTADSASSLCADFPARFPANVVVEAAGRRHEREVHEAPGDPGRRLDDAALAQKIERVCAAHGEDAGFNGANMSDAAALTDVVAARALAARFDQFSSSGAH